MDVCQEVPAINSDYETALISCCSKMERLKFIDELSLFSISRSDETPSVDYIITWNLLPVAKVLPASILHHVSSKLHGLMRHELYSTD